MINYVRPTLTKKKVIAVGNPPYQESDGGFGKSARNIYPLFVESLMSADQITEFVLIIPARWFAAGKGLENFRTKIKNSVHIQHLRYFEKANELFPSVDINGGVCFLHYNRSFRGKTTFSDGVVSVQTSLSEFDILPDDPLAFSILRKVQKKWQGRFVGDHAWPSKPFGLRTNHFDLHPTLNASNPKAIPVLSKGRKIFYGLRSLILKNEKFINLWKVSVPKAAGGSKGKRRSTVPRHQIFLVEPGTITTETYNIIETFSSQKEAENFIKYLQTDFARYLVGLRKMSQDLPPDRWNWVPSLKMNKQWTDETLANYFGLSDEEKNHLRRKVQAWS